ncbi:MAG TPA: tRNA (adenosine(37)-N6)-threonylcarbamoyltransferase complex transferase subunit TsaD [Candidatus Saccharimonadales bacterium]|nr:tRNA (adenosine(37)-N6)-threonylcarbamoyltransferase complex transferase subunit TsaD [Candidatus Saccharimonadales bacterium]
MKVLGIESSCDETAASVVEDGERLLSNVVASSMDLHAQYGGVIPEIAARSHIEAVIPVITQALDDAGCTWDDIDAIAVTYGAGLLGSLLIGVLTARTLAITHNKPLYAVNHVEGHIYVNFLNRTGLQGYNLPNKQPEFPMLGVIVSGGHSQLVLWRDHFDYTLLGQTQDDAIGEAFDKVAKTIGLPYPGGINVSRKALEGNAHAFKLPKARMDGRYDFSFSGLKTAVLRLAQEQVGKDYSLPSTELPGLLNEAQKADIAASFQRVACETIVDKAVMACEEFKPKTVVIGGGVAANSELRKQLAERLPLPIEYTDIKLCGDNGAMIATLGSYHHMFRRPQADPLKLEVAPNLSM